MHESAADIWIGRNNEVKQRKKKSVNRLRVNTYSSINLNYSVVLSVCTGYRHPYKYTNMYNIRVLCAQCTVLLYTNHQHDTAENIVFQFRPKLSTSKCYSKFRNNRSLRYPLKKKNGQEAYATEYERWLSQLFFIGSHWWRMASAHSYHNNVYPRCSVHKEYYTNDNWQESLMCACVCVWHESRFNVYDVPKTYDEDEIKMKCDVYLKYK